MSIIEKEKKASIAFFMFHFITCLIHALKMREKSLHSWGL